MHEWSAIVDLDALRIFTAVARRGSFSPVARELGLDPSSVSRSVAGIEAELGVRLFQRSTRRMTLTEAGLLFLDRVEDMIELADSAREEVQAIGRGPVGTLRLATSVAFGQMCIVPALQGFRERFPALKLELILSDDNVDLINNRIDLAIRLAPMVDVNVIAARLLDTHYKVVCTPEYRAGSPSPLKLPEDLMHHNCLRFSFPDYRDRWLFKAGDGRVSEVPVDGDLLVSNALVLRGCALAGMGPTLLPDWLIGADVEQGRLVDCFPRHKVAATSFETAAWLLYPSRNFLPNKVRVTIDYLRTAITQGRTLSER
jgi:DNA-binding transcriptional LysR family regulator